MKSFPRKIGTIAGCAMLATVLMSASNPFEDGYDEGPIGAWEMIDESWHFTNPDNTQAIGWTKITSGRPSDTWYYFEPSGAMATGWKNLDGKWYYLGPSDDEEPGWKEVDGKSYYVERPGVMTVGWQYIGGAWYYFEPSGEMVRGWKEINHDLYYFNEDGSMKTGWFEMDEKLYRALPEGNVHEYDPADVVEKPGAFTVSAAKKKAAEEAARIVVDDWDKYCWTWNGEEIPKPTIKNLSTLTVGEAIPILNLVEGKLIYSHNDLYPIICDDKIITSMLLSEEDTSEAAGGLRTPPTESIKEAGYLGGPRVEVYGLMHHLDILQQGCAVIQDAYHYPGFLVNSEAVEYLRSYSGNPEDEQKPPTTPIKNDSSEKDQYDPTKDKSTFEVMKDLMVQIPDTLLVSKPLEL